MDDNIEIGKKGNIGSGYIFAPYIPVYSTPIVDENFINWKRRKIRELRKKKLERLKNEYTI